MKLASRLSALYAVLLGVTVLIVILASSIALVVELSGFTGDVVIAKHFEARILADRFHREGITLAQSAPEIVAALSGIGLRVTVFDQKGRYLRAMKRFGQRCSIGPCTRRNGALYSTSFRSVAAWKAAAGSGRG